MQELINTKQLKLEFNNNLINKNILEGQYYRTKVNSLISDYKESLNKSGNLDVQSIDELNKVKDSLSEHFKIIDSYNELINQLIRHVENKTSSFYDIFFPVNEDEKKDLIFNLYPQTMPLEHYKEIFELCGYFPHFDYEKLTQLTMQRLACFIKYQKFTDTIDVQDSYFVSELHGIIKDSKIKEIVNRFWSSGVLNKINTIMENKGGKIILNEERLKVFELQKISQITNCLEQKLIYATHSFFSYEVSELKSKIVGDYLFLAKEPKKSTVIIERMFTINRQDFLKNPDVSNVSFNIKVCIPINLFEFRVIKQYK